MANFVAVYDACVLYPAQPRNLLLHLAVSGAFRARWTERIHDEWMRSVLKRHADLDRSKLERIRRYMDEAVPDCLVRDSTRRASEYGVEPHSDALPFRLTVAVVDDPLK